MNIFYTNEDPLICAKEHCYTHVVKMILEYSQLLCTAHRMLDPELEEDHDLHGLYKKTHPNHPSTIWVRTSSKHYEWLYRLLLNLHTIYEIKKGKAHKSTFLLERLASLPNNIVNSDSWVDPFIAINQDDYPECHETFAKWKSIKITYQHYMNLKYLEWKNRVEKRPIHAKWIFNKPDWVYTV